MSDYMEIARKALERQQQEPEERADLEPVLKGLAVELWSDLAGDVLFLVADEEDAGRLGGPRGTIYTAVEARMVCRITDRAIVRQVHAYKRRLEGIIREHRSEARSD